jgi:hypothetical protein
VRRSTEPWRLGRSSTEQLGKGTLKGRLHVEVVADLSTNSPFQPVQPNGSG